ncbi:MAG: transglycosylase domain-containing protein [Clostridia bacterium]|nr:transglycosylase domain-containing protein [Clostridia bacterium]
MTKFVKILLVTVLSIIIVIISLFCAYLIITKDAVLNHTKLNKPEQSVIIIDDDGNEIASTSSSGKKSVKIENLDDTCKNAFIASEDRKFYSHNGLNYGRMIKAFFKNIAAGSFKEGASTISQQLIKNTHLSQDKTIKRKLKEIRLTKQLERAYSKDEILEMYLNTIFFGHNCYGLQSAAEFYFDKKAEDLSLTESATLVGLLTSPNNYSPFKNPEKSLQKRNTVLKSMLDCNFIDKATYDNAINEPLNAQKSDIQGRNADYIDAVFDELERLDIGAYDLANGYKIKTFMTSALQSKIEALNFETDNAIIVTTKKGGVCAYKTTINGAKRQPGSTVKPTLIYAPAIEEKLINPSTRILDEKIDFNGYSPENFDKKYHGYVSVAESIKYSYNVPAVKTLNSLTIKNAEKYLTKMNLALDDEEKNLSLALGGMKYGLTIQNIADCYSIFQNGGIYSPSRFIDEITDASGKQVYKSEKSKSRVFSNGTCSLINETLIDVSKSGTAKKLASLDYDVAAKTGTCGTEEGNTDAYAVGYTSEHCVAVWLGDKDNKKLSITGGNDSCEYLKEVLKYLYAEQKPSNLDITSGTSIVEIDAEEYYTNNRIILKDDFSPKLNNLQIKVLSDCKPTEKCTRFTQPSIKAPTITVAKNSINISLCQTKYYSYLVKRYKNNDFKVIYDGNWKKTITDTPDDGTYTYTVTPYYLYGQNKIFGKEITLPNVIVNSSSSAPQIKIPDIADKEWYNL